MELNSLATINKSLQFKIAAFCAMSHEWADLPLVVLTSVYLYLSDDDRASMARVCRHWLLGFSSASLWREKSFRFIGFRTNRPLAKSMLGFARCMGQHLRYLQLSCEHPSFLMCKQFQRTAGSFFTILNWKRTRLRTLSLRHFNADRYWRSDFLRERFVTSVCRFLRSQGNLEEVLLNDAVLPATNGLRILEALAFRSGSKVSSLNIEDFFASRLAAFQSVRYISVISRFTNLVILNLNYNYISEEVLESVARSSSRKLLSLHMRVYKYDPHFHRIDHLTWIKVKRLCPNLTVSMYFEGLGKFPDISGILNPETPLQAITMWTGIHMSDEDWRLGDTLLYIGEHFNKTLGKIGQTITICIKTSVSLGDFRASRGRPHVIINSPVREQALQCREQEN